ncbi:MAG: tryptophan synthase subunit alpha [Sulfurospirillum sp.]|nr:tryptophan synthase subunit alpha [Sulfurospirillum sp.]
MKTLVAYITAGFPDIAFTKDLALGLADAGADKIELGIPFSDPVADGPVIEVANLKALQAGFKLEQLFDIASHIAPQIDTYWMGYFNSFYHRGFESFAKKAQELGVKGFIVPDMPFEESIQYAKILDQTALSLVSFVAPTDDEARIKRILKNAKDFVYLVAYAGITGSGVSEDLQDILTQIRLQTKTPVFVGFGVDEKTAKQKAQGADGVIVGSAFVKVLLDESLNGTQKIEKITSLARTIKESINS